MGRLLGLAALALLTGCTLRPPAPLQLVVGCSGPTCPGLLRYAFDPQSGRLEASPAQRLPLANATWLVVDPGRPLLFAVDEQPQGRVSSLGIGARSELTVLDSVDSGGAEPTYASLSEDGRALFVAHYATEPRPGGSLSLLPVSDTGSLGPVRQRWHQPFEQPGSLRQGSSHLHAAVAIDRQLLVTDLGADRVYAFDYRSTAKGPTLTPADPPFLAVPTGSGPRHLVFDARGRHGYLSLELGNQVALLERQGTRLTFRGQVDLDPAPAAGDNRLGALHLSQDGRFLYVARRGVHNQIVAYRVREDGGLDELQRHDSGGEEPREFTLSPDGRFLLVANQRSDRITVLRRDPASGRLQDVVQELQTPAPATLRFLP